MRWHQVVKLHQHGW